MWVLGVDTVKVLALSRGGALRFVFAVSAHGAIAYPGTAGGHKPWKGCGSALAHMASDDSLQLQSRPWPLLRSPQSGPGTKQGPILQALPKQGTRGCPKGSKYHSGICTAPKVSGCRAQAIGQ